MFGAGGLATSQKGLGGNNTTLNQSRILIPEGNLLLPPKNTFLHSGQFHLQQSNLKINII